MGNVNGRVGFTSGGSHFVDEAAAKKKAADEAARVEAERVEAERVEAMRVAEVQRVEAARVEAERLAEAQRVEAARVEAERVEAERVAEVQRVEGERLEAERVEAMRLEAVRVEAERVAEVQRVEAERLEVARVAEVQRVEAHRLQVVHNAPPSHRHHNPNANQHPLLGTIDGLVTMWQITNKLVTASELPVWSFLSGSDASLLVHSGCNIHNRPRLHISIKLQRGARWFLIECRAPQPSNGSSVVNPIFNVLELDSEQHLESLATQVAAFDMCDPLCITYPPTTTAADARSDGVKMSVGNIDVVRELVIAHADREMKTPSLVALQGNISTPRPIASAVLNPDTQTNCVHFAISFVYAVAGQDAAGAFSNYLSEKVTEVLEQLQDDQ